MRPALTSRKLVTFDVYSALLDIEGSLTPVLRYMLGLTPDEARPLVRDWRARQMARATASNSLGRGRISFREATRMALDAVLVRNGPALGESARPDLVMAWDEMDPWPEARDVVAKVKALGYPVAILSNGDQDMLDAVAGLFDGCFDHVLSSETAGWYKPHPAVYALPTERLGVATDQVLHVAGGAMDVLGAVAADMPCLWSNRSGDALLDPAFPPDYEFPDLEGLLQVL